MEFFTHEFRATRACPTLGYGTNATITVRAGLHKIDGNDRPYFSVTADIRKPCAHDIEAGGCLHREILHYWPQLAPIVALHLSDDFGVHARRPEIAIQVKEIR